MEKRPMENTLALLQAKEIATVKEMEIGGVKFCVAKSLSLQQRQDFVSAVTATCAVDGILMPSLYDFAWRIHVIDYFTDLAVPRDDLDAMQVLAYRDDILDAIYAYACDIDLLHDAVRKQLEHEEKLARRLAAAAAAPNPLRELAAKAGNILDALLETFQNTDMTRLEELINKFDAIDKNTLAAKLVQAGQEAVLPLEAQPE